MSTTRTGLGAQVGRFVAVGVVGAVVDFSLLIAGMAAGLGHTPAKALSWLAGTLTAYALNRRWTFDARRSWRTFAAVMALYATTFVVQVGLFELGFRLLTAAGWPLLAVQTVAFVVAQGVATTVNFIVQRRWIFRPSD